jgi:hypothetical protein
MDVIYEVNLEIDRHIEFEYRSWLQVHIAEILALPGFVSAQCLARVEPAAQAGRLALCVQYRLTDRASLEAYLELHAPRLRADGVARFGGRFEASRRVLLEERLNPRPES